MLGRTHALFGVGIGFLVAISGNLQGPKVSLGLAVAVLFSLLPDIDDPKSVIGRLFWFVSSILKYVFKIKHRGVTHSIWAILFIGVLSVIINCFNVDMFYLGLIAFISYAGHIFLDMFTKEGVCLLYPRRKRYRLFNGIFHTGSFLEKVFFSICSVLIGFEMYIYYIVMG